MLVFTAVVVLAIAVLETYRSVVAVADSLQDLFLPGIGDRLPEPVRQRLSTMKDRLVTEGMSLEETCADDGYCGLVELGGRLTAGTWLDHDRMYVADWDGAIRLYDVVGDKATTVVNGLVIPQGLAVLDDRLYVAHMGKVCESIRKLLSEGEANQCKPYKRRYGDVANILGESGGEILSFRIDQSGGLSDERVVLDRIATYSVDHSANGMISDGRYIYVSIGHPEESLRGTIHARTDELREAGVRTELMGVIARIHPSDNTVDVYATGLRNVYQISLGPDGTIWGSDNDMDRESVHKEELNAIVQGGFYGFPEFGTGEAPAGSNVIEPRAILQGSASTVAYANADGVYVAYTHEEQDSGVVVDRFEYDTMSPTRVFSKGKSYVTSILERADLLYLVTHSGHIHIIDPKRAPITSR